MNTKIQLTNFRYIKSLLVVSFLLFSLSATAPDTRVVFIFVSKPIDPYERLVNAVIKIESSGDTLAYNPVEKAIGAFQIRPIRLLDYNMRTGNNYKHKECYNLLISKKIFLYYAKKTGYPNYETIARDWNGSGKTTLDYWKRVRSNL
jgi:hypothetical protein